MNNILCEKLNLLVDQWSKNNKMPIYGFDQMHVCTSNCKLIGEYPNFICTASRKIHVCGKNCDNPYTTSEGTFCSLTGFEVEGPVDETSSLVVRDSCGKSTRHWGDRIRAGKKKTEQTCVLRSKECHKFISAFGETFLIFRGKNRNVQFGNGKIFFVHP